MDEDMSTRIPKKKLLNMKKLIHTLIIFAFLKKTCPKVILIETLIHIKTGLNPNFQKN